MSYKAVFPLNILNTLKRIETARSAMRGQAFNTAHLTAKAPNKGIGEAGSVRWSRKTGCPAGVKIDLESR